MSKYWTKSNYQQGGLRDPHMRAHLYGLRDDINNLTNTHSLLDIGCNNGGFPILLHDSFTHTHGFDVDQNAIDVGKQQIAQQQINNCELHCMDYKQFKQCNTQTYDMVLSLAVHERVCTSNNMTREQYFDEVLNLVSPDGVLVIESHFFLPSYDTIDTWNNMKQQLSKHSTMIVESDSTKGRKFCKFKK